VERLGCALKVRAMEQVTAEEIRDSLAAVIRKFLEVGDRLNAGPIDWPIWYRMRNQRTIKERPQRWQRRPASAAGT